MTAGHDFKRESLAGFGFKRIAIDLPGRLDATADARRHSDFLRGRSGVVSKAAMAPDLAAGPATSHTP